MTLQLREARVSDASALHVLVEEAYKRTDYSKLPRVLSFEHTISRWIRSESRILLVAEKDGKLLGFLGAVVMPYAVCREKVFVNCKYLYVSECGGIGKALLDRLYAIAQELEAEELFVTTLFGRTNALPRFFRSIGYSLIGSQHFRKTRYSEPLARGGEIMIEEVSCKNLADVEKIASEFHAVSARSFLPFEALPNVLSDLQKLSQDKLSQGIALLAYANGICIGLLAARRKRLLGTSVARMHLKYLYVSPKARTTKVVRRLLGHMDVAALQFDAQYIHLATSGGVNSARAALFLRALGYPICGYSFSKPVHK